MRIHRIVATLIPALIVGLLAVLGVPGPAQAAEPDESLRTITSEVQRERIAATQAFDVPVRAVEVEGFAQQMQERCGQYLSSPTFAKRELSGLPRLSAKTELDKGDLPARVLSLDLDDNPTSEQKQAALEASQDYAKVLLGAMADYREVCIAIEETRKLSAGQFGLLRKIYTGDEHDAFFSWLYEIHAEGGHESLFSILDAKSYDEASAFVEDFAPARGGGPPQGGIPGSPLSELAQTAFEGLAEFLIERGKQELTEYLQDQLVTKICSQANDPILFIPNTCQILGGLDGSLSIASIGATLHGALVKDLELLPDRSVVLASTLVPEVAYSGTLVRALMPLVRDAGARARPLDYAASFYAAPLVDCELAYAKIRAQEGGGLASGQGEAEETVAATIARAERNCSEMMAILRLGSAVTSAAAGMVPDGGIGAAPELPYFALGLLFGLEERVAVLHELGVDKTLFELLELDEAWWNAEHRHFEAEAFAQVFGLAQVSSTAIQDITTAIDSLGANGPVRASALFSVTSRVVLSLSDIMGEVIELSPKVEAELAGVAQGAKVSREVLALAEAFAVEDWAGAVLGTMKLVLELADKHGGPASSGAGDKPSGVVEITVALRRYLPLFIEIATAQSSDQVNAALQAAFPAGGYKRKFRENVFSLNAYLGAYGGATVSNGFESDALAWGQVGGEFALYAPVGADFGWVASSKWKNSHVGFFVPLVDLGAITTAKWLEQERQDPVDISDGMTMATQETELSEPSVFNLAGIVAPGLYFRVGIAESPVTFGLGATVSPFAHKRTITRRDSVGDIESTREKFLPAVRMGAFLAVDITFLSVGYNKR